MHISESSTSRPLGTSRGTIREAIRHLVQEGLAEYELHRGTFVRALSVDDRLDVYVAREAIEVGAVTRLLAQTHDPDLDALEAALETLRRAARGRRRPTEGMIAADLSFHQELVTARRQPQARSRVRDPRG